MKRENAMNTDQKHPLRWLLLAWLGVVYLQRLLDGSSGPRIPLTDAHIPLPASIDPALFALVAFTVFMVLHSVLHTFALFKNVPPYLLLPYFLGQGLLVLAIFSLGDGQGAVFGLCLVLTLEAIHLLKQPRLLIAVVEGYLLLYVLTLNPLQSYLSVDPSLFLHKLVSSLTFIMFVIACVILYNQRAKAHQQDQELLYALASTHAQLEAAHIQLEDYAARVEALTLVTERQRLARELHDTLAQGLVGLGMQLETINGLLLRERSQQAREIVQQALSSVRTTLADARDAIDDLRSEAANSLDGLEGMREEIQRFTVATGIPCHADMEALALLPRPLHEHILRILSESLTNIARHARASEVWIRTKRDDEDELTLEICDNGVGFDAAAMMTLAGHYGLLGLRERARLIGGHLEITSVPGQGTTLRFTFLLSDQGQEVASGAVLWKSVNPTTGKVGAHE
jgi:NarL family two-component system sensor histidine kinase YdfH